VLRVTADAPARVEESVRALAWCDEETCAVGDADGNVQLWQPGLQRLEPLHPSPRDDDSCAALGVHPTRPLLVSGWDSGRVRIHPLGAGVTVELDLREPVDSVAFAPGRAELVAVAAGHDVVIVDLDGDIVVGEWYRRGAAVCLCWIDETLLAIGGNGGVTFLPTVPVPVLDLPPAMPAPGVVLDLCLDAAGAQLAAADLRGEVRITDLHSGEELSLDGHGDRVRGVEWFGGDRLLAVAAEDELAIWERAPSDLEPEPWVHGPVEGPSVAPTACDDGTLVAVGGHDGHVVVVDARRPSEPASTAWMDDAVTALAWRPGGTDLAVGTAGGRLTLLNC
jgi:WD40 repeat protein